MQQRTLGGIAFSCGRWPLDPERTTPIPRASRVHVAGAGHFVPIEKPLEVNAVIASFPDAYGL